MRIGRQIFSLSEEIVLLGQDLGISKGNFLSQGRNDVDLMVNSALSKWKRCCFGSLSVEMLLFWALSAENWC